MSTIRRGRAHLVRVRVSVRVRVRVRVGVRVGVGVRVRVRVRVRVSGGRAHSACSTKSMAMRFWWPKGGLRPITSSPG